MNEYLLSDKPKFLLPLRIDESAQPYMQDVANAGKRNLLYILYRAFADTYIGLPGSDGLTVTMVSDHAATPAPIATAASSERHLLTGEIGAFDVIRSATHRSLPELFASGVSSTDHDSHPPFPALVLIQSRQVMLPSGNTNAKAFAAAFTDTFDQFKGHQVLGFYILGSELFAILPYEHQGTRKMDSIGEDGVAFCRTLQAAPRLDQFIQPAPAPNLPFGAQQK